MQGVPAVLKPTKTDALIVDEVLGRHRWNLTWGGIADFGQHPRNHPHRHLQSYEFCLVLEGQGVHSSSAGTQMLKSGHLMVTAPEMEHEIRCDHDGGLRLAWWMMSVSEASSTMLSQPFDSDAQKILEAFLGQVRFHVSGEYALNAYVQMIQNADPCSERGQWRRQRAFRSLALDSLLALTGQGIQLGRLKPLSPHRDPVTLACEHLERDLAGIKTVADLARRVGLGERHLRRHFQVRLGHGPQEEMNRRRVMRAADLLIYHSDLHAVATSVGVGGTDQLSRLFKRYLGCTAASWRQDHYCPNPLPVTLRDSTQTMKNAKQPEGKPSGCCDPAKANSGIRP